MLQSRPITTVGQSATPTDGHAVTGAQPVSTAAEAGVVLVRGLGAAPGRASGAVRLLRSLDETTKLAAGDVLVTHMTSPDWVPLMRRRLRCH